MASTTPAHPALRERLLAALVHEPTAGQLKAIDAFDRLLATEKENATLILRGYAGTGKTTLVGALVKVLQRHMPVVLLAPTGRAAKVLQAHAGRTASTIHRRIYRMAGDDGAWSGVDVAHNRDQGALFIVDEASMIGTNAEASFGDRDLLQDLLQHIFSGDGCKLLFVGDPAQLPPVGSDHSPALSVKDLRVFGLTAGMIELTEVVRQADASGILRNATELRALLTTAPSAEAPREGTAPVLLPHFVPYPDVIRVDGHDLQEALETAYARQGDEEVCVVCRSNKRAYLYNQQVRARIHGYEEELCPSDRLMVVKNNYLWAGLNGKPELIANG
ncbi:MAG TPA: AAA family ATPase, partial [Flavobacteriales bacterium]|nr:AAA family ATPase [Flavobacteriales bacterium]